MMEQKYRVEGLHCGACVAKVRDALRGVEGVAGATVTLTPPRAEVESASPIPLTTLNAAVAQRGAYSLTEAPESADTGGEVPRKESLFPLFLIVGYILGVAALLEWMSDAPSWMNGMRNFMAGFFLVFSFFKLLDLPGFVTAYRGYDLLARGVPAWGWVYPFVELALGVAYLMDWKPVPVSWGTLALMVIGAVGVLNALLNKRKIVCACLGTALNLPMTKVTLIEDLTMAAMAGAMIYHHSAPAI